MLDKLDSNNHSTEVELFKVLFTIYSMTKGHPKYPIVIQLVAENLGIDMYDEKYGHLHDNMVYMEHEGLLTSYRSKFMTILGINEIEDSIIDPEKGTLHFPPGISRFVEVDESIIKDIPVIKKARKDFLIKTYEFAEGRETTLVNISDVSNALGLEKDIFDKSYWYLIEDGLIEAEFSGIIKLTHMGRLKIEEQIPGTEDNFWNAQYPNVTVSDDIVTIIDNINAVSINLFGCEIFKNRAGPIKDLRTFIRRLNNDSKDKSAFISCLLSIGLILGDVYIPEIKKHVVAKDDDGPLVLVEKLFITREVKYNESDFDLLRKLVRLRSTTPPVHNAEEKSIKVLEYLGIDFPVVDWAEAGNICLQHLQSALEAILENLKKSDSN